MENLEIISIATLRGKLKALEEQIQKLDEQRQHIEWVLENFSADASHQTKVESAPSRKDAVIEILKNNGRPMRSGEIYVEMIKIGRRMKKNTFDALMSILIREPNGPVARAGYGLYEYRQFPHQNNAE